MKNAECSVGCIFHSHVGVNLRTVQSSCTQVHGHDENLFAEAAWTGKGRKTGPALKGTSCRSFPETVAEGFFPQTKSPAPVLVTPLTHPTLS